MRLLYLTFQYSTSLASSKVQAEKFALISSLFPGSVIYGPGFAYETNKIEEIFEACGGESSFDAILCEIPERELAGDAFGHNVVARYNLPSNLWRFPPDLRKSRLPKILALGDFWHLTPEEWAKVFARHQFDLVLTSMLFPFSSKSIFHYFFPPEIRERAVFLPFGLTVSTEIFSDQGLKREYDVVMAGAQTPEFYPVRYHMLQAFRQSGLCLYEPPHPGYAHVRPGTLPSNDYPRDLNISKISAFCATKFHFPTQKLLEAMACRTVAMCDHICGVEHLGMVPGEHFILADGSNCVEKAGFLLDHPEKYQDMIDKSHALIHSRHTLPIRFREIAEMLPAVLNGEKAHGWAELSPNLRLIRAKRRMAQLHPESNSVEVTRRPALENGAAISPEVWEYWYALSPLPLFTSDMAEYVRLPNLLAAQNVALAHMEAFKAQQLCDMIRENGFNKLLEIGAGAGFYSLTWAALLNKSGKRGAIFAEDPLAHNQAHPYMSPLYMDLRFSRERLWAGLPDAGRVTFVQREPGRFGMLKKHKLDLIFFNDSADIYEDYRELRDSVNDKTLLVVNKYGDSHPAIVEQTLRLARESGRRVLHLDFSPYNAGLAVCHKE